MTSKTTPITQADLDTLPKVWCPLLGEDGNAFAIMGRFRMAARNAGWKAPAIQAVLDKAMEGDYSQLLATIMRYVEEA